MLILNNLAMKPENNQPKIAKNSSFVKKNEINKNSNINVESLNLIATQVSSVADEVFDPEDITNMASIATILTFMIINNLSSL